MADVATKNKSMNAVSNIASNKSKTKMNDVCGVQSNNGLIDLESLSASNNQLISLCEDDDDEDDMILANNTRNELGTDDKSLQEIIESELALRICSNTNVTLNPEEFDNEEEESVRSQPEIRKIVLEPRQDPVDVNSEFIVAEKEYYTQNPYEFPNGHISPETHLTNSVGDDHDSGFRAEEENVFEGQVESEDIEITYGNVQLNQEKDSTGEMEEDAKALEDEPAISYEETCPFENADEDSSQEISHQTVLSTDKYQQEEESQSKELDEYGTNLTSAEDESQKLDELQDEEISESREESAILIGEDQGATLKLLESEIQDAELNAGREENYGKNEIEIVGEQVKEDVDESEVSPNEDETSESTYEPEEPISSKEAAGIDEKVCSFYVSDADTNGKMIDNDCCTNDFKGNDFDKEQTNGDVDVIDFISSEVPKINGDVWNNPELDLDTKGDHAEVKDESEIYSEDIHEDFESRDDSDDALGDDSESLLLAPLATPDEISEISNNTCDNSESREEVITTTIVTTKKKKKIESTGGSDASPNHTKIKKTKKSKKNELEKENISVKRKTREASMHTISRQESSEMIEFSNEDDLSNVNVKSLTRTYVSETNRVEQDKSNKEIIATGVSIKQLKSSFNKFDALTKKSVLRTVDTGKGQQQLNSVGQNGDANPNCRSCGKVVFQMEQTKAEGLVWHKNCFRCVQCSKQLNVDNYESNESTLYCKAHFKELFQPKPVEESDQPTSDKPDLGLEELSSLNVKSRFQVFEKASTETTNDLERSPSQVAVKRSPSILSKLAKFQAKGMDIGVADESLNGIPFEESSASEEEIDEDETEDAETDIIKAKRGTRERPISFTKMDDIKNRWETTSQQGRRESQREARKEEIAGIRSRLFMGKQGKMKEMYQQAVADSERVTKINAAEEIQHATNARSIKERFERGEPIAASDDEDGKLKQEKPDEEVIAAGISRKSRSLFLELDATAAKTGRPVTPINQTKVPVEAPRRARDMDSPDHEVYRDPEVVRSEDRVDEVVRTDTARKMLSIFRQMEENASKEDLPEGPKPLKRFTPPPEDKFAKATASESEDDEEDDAEESDGEDGPDDPNYVRASDKVEDEFLKQAQNAARAKTLRAKFEHWETTDGKTRNHNVAEMEMAQTTGAEDSIESASSLRARFESLGSPSNDSPRTPKVKVNRFVELQTNCTDVCESCDQKVYPLEKVETNNKIFHKKCFRCLQCNCVLRMDTFTLNNGKLYCMPHFKQLFITRGNYEEGFGMDQHKNKWSASTQAPIIAVRNGDV